MVTTFAVSGTGSAVGMAAIFGSTMSFFWAMVSMGCRAALEVLWWTALALWSSAIMVELLTWAALIVAGCSVAAFIAPHGWALEPVLRTFMARSATEGHGSLRTGAAHVAPTFTRTATAVSLAAHGSLVMMSVLHLATTLFGATRAAVIWAAHVLALTTGTASAIMRAAHRSLRVMAVLHLAATISIALLGAALSIVIGTTCFATISIRSALWAAFIAWRRTFAFWPVVVRAVGSAWRWCIWAVAGFCIRFWRSRRWGSILCHGGHGPEEGGGQQAGEQTVRRFHMECLVG